MQFSLRVRCMSLSLTLHYNGRTCGLRTVTVALVGVSLLPLEVSSHAAQIHCKRDDVGHTHQLPINNDVYSPKSSVSWEHNGENDDYWPCLRCAATTH